MKRALVYTISSFVSPNFGHDSKTLYCKKNFWHDEATFGMYFFLARCRFG